MKRYLFAILAAVFALCSCNIDSVLEEEMPMKPEIILDNDGVYSVKEGREVVIAPGYRYVEGAAYKWSIDGRVVGHESSYTFKAGSAGRVYILLEVSTQHGSAREELRIEVSELALPLISLPGAAEGFALLAGESLELAPAVAATGLETSFRWEMQSPGEESFGEVADTKDYTFAGNRPGLYAMRFTTENEDGSDSVTFAVRVSMPEDAEFVWEFPQTEFNIASGRRIRLLPRGIRNAFDAEYIWTADGAEVQRSGEAAFVFEGAAEGAHRVTVTMKNSYTEHTQTLTVNVCAAEGAFKRPKTGDSSSDWNKVWEYTPAPGQFINDGFTVTTAAEAAAYAESRLKMGNAYVSLGGFGGYIVVGFDHSIENTGGYDFAVGGNSFDTSSEPGIVWVMQDENGDGLPNDTWYELAGSETGLATTIQDYAVTYYRPSARAMDVQWSDNLGNTGCIDYVKSFHRQDFYYPAWIEADKYTLWGTCLEARNYDPSGNGSNWVQPPYDWGYADNCSSVDRLGGSISSDDVNVNVFKISNAVDFEGKPVELKYIDFVKVQTGVNAKSGWLGELSTEVFGFSDLSIER